MTTSSYTRVALRIGALFCTAALTSLGLGLGCSAPGSSETGSTSQAVGSTGLVISAVYGGGGNAGATFTNDFVELYNRGANSVSLNGMSVQYGSATADFGAPVALPNVTIAPGRYFLLQLASGGANGVALPTADATGTTNLSGTNGKVALASVTTALACGGATRCATANVVDMVGYGTASDYEGATGSAVAALTATSGAFRKGAGCTDSDVNVADFDVVTPVAVPRNQATAAAICGSGGDAGSDASDDGASTDGAAGDASDDGATADASDDGATDGAIDDGATDDGATDDGATDGGADSGPSDSGPSDSGPVEAGPPGDGTGLVISALYGGGGNSGAIINHDFVELFNRSNSNVATNGLSIQYGSAARDFGSPLADGGPSVDILPLPDMVIPSGAYVLVSLSTSNADSGAPIPTPDVQGALSLASTNGKVALAKVTTGLGCGGTTRCTTANVVDMVGYGTSTDFEGSAAVAVLSNTTGAARKGAGCTDTNDNKADFDVAAPAPRNTATARVKCTQPTPDAGPNPGDDAGTDDGGGPIPPAKDAGHGGSSGGVDGGGNGDTGGSSDTGGCATSGAGTGGESPLAFAIAALGAVMARRRRRA